MNKPILVFYINVSSISSATKTKETLRTVAERVKHDDLITYVLPVKDRPTEVICVNPVVMNDEQYETIKKLIEDNMEKVHNTLESIK